MFRSGGLSLRFLEMLKMLRRPVLLGMGLVTALAGPYVWVESGSGGALRGSWNRLVGQESPAADDLLAGLELPQHGGGPAGTAFGSHNPSGAIESAGGLESGATIEQAFRFDVTPDWVAHRWQRVSTVLGEADQLGMRVAFVSGTRADDVAGSLTYYFDPHHRLQRITFFGTTGQPQRLLATVVTPHGLVSRPTTGWAHYIAGDPQQPTSQVSVRHLPMVDSQASVRMEVAVDLRRGDIGGRIKRPARERWPPSTPRSY